MNTNAVSVFSFAYPLYFPSINSRAVSYKKTAKSSGNNNYIGKYHGKNNNKLNVGIESIAVSSQRDV